MYLWVGGWGLIENVFTFTDDLDLSRSQPCKIKFWAISKFLLVTFILKQPSLGGGLSLNKKKPLSDLHGQKDRTKALRMTILASRFIFVSSRIQRCHLFSPMNLTFQGHDLCKITFWAISWLLMGKMLPSFNTR